MTSTDKARRRVWPRWLLFGCLVLAAYLCLWPVPIEPVAWQAPTPPALEGPYAPDTRLAEVELFGLGKLPGPEVVLLDSAGVIFTGLADGRIVRLASLDADPELVVDTGGRPLGMAWDAQGRLIVADAYRGLLCFDPEGGLQVLCEQVDGVPLGFADDLDIAADGTIYFSDASSRHGVEEPRLDLLEHRPSGRLLAYDPTSGESRVVLDSLYFANGVAVSPDQSFVLVNETGAYRVRRLWLTGPDKGRVDTFIDNLPGFPDNITAGPDGIFWLALVAPRNAAADALAPYPFLRKLLVRLPKFLWPEAARHAWVLGLDSQGRVVHNLQDARPQSYSPLTSACVWEGHLYLGSLRYNGLARLPRP